MPQSPTVPGRSSGSGAQPAVNGCSGGAQASEQGLAGSQEMPHALAPRPLLASGSSLMPTIPFNDLEIMEQIGEGSYGRVGGAGGLGVAGGCGVARWGAHARLHAVGVRGRAPALRPLAAVLPMPGMYGTCRAWACYVSFS